MIQNKSQYDSEGRRTGSWSELITYYSHWPKMQLKTGMQSGLYSKGRKFGIWKIMKSDEDEISYLSEEVLYI